MTIPAYILRTTSMERDRADDIGVKMMRPIRAMPRTPPTTPPAIAPVFEEEDGEAERLGVAEAEVEDEETGLEEDVLEVELALDEVVLLARVEVVESVDEVVVELASEDLEVVLITPVDGVEVVNEDVLEPVNEIL